MGNEQSCENFRGPAIEEWRQQNALEADHPRPLQKTAPQSLVKTSAHMPSAQQPGAAGKTRSSNSRAARRRQLRETDPAAYRKLLERQKAARGRGRKRYKERKRLERQALQRQKSATTREGDQAVRSHVTRLVLEHQQTHAVSTSTHASPSRIPEQDRGDYEEDSKAAWEEEGDDDEIDDNEPSDEDDSEEEDDEEKQEQAHIDRVAKDNQPCARTKVARHALQDIESFPKHVSSGDKSSSKDNCSDVEQAEYTSGYSISNDQLHEPELDEEEVEESVREGTATDSPSNQPANPIEQTATKRPRDHGAPANDELPESSKRQKRRHSPDLRDSANGTDTSNGRVMAGIQALHNELMLIKTNSLALSGLVDPDPVAYNQSLSPTHHGEWPIISRSNIFEKAPVGEQAEQLSKYMSEMQEYMLGLQVGALPASKVFLFFRRVIAYINTVGKTLDDLEDAFQRRAGHHVRVQEEVKKAESERKKIEKLPKGFQSAITTRAITQNGEGS